MTRSMCSCDANRNCHLSFRFAISNRVEPHPACILRYNLQSYNLCMAMAIWGGMANRASADCCYIGFTGLGFFVC